MLRAQKSLARQVGSVVVLLLIVAVVAHLSGMAHTDHMGGHMPPMTLEMCLVVLAAALALAPPGTPATSCGTVPRAEPRRLVPEAARTRRGRYPPGEGTVLLH